MSQAGERVEEAGSSDATEHIVNISEGQSQSVSQAIGEEMDDENRRFLRRYESASLRANIKRADCTKLGHQIKMTAPSLNILKEGINIKFTRQINKVLEEVCADLPQTRRVFARSNDLCDQCSEEYSFPLPIHHPSCRGVAEEGWTAMVLPNSITWTAFRLWRRSRFIRPV
ncbi:unnamed protein product [Pleuronectes platessa]|uniref:Uncharacterized protein n=1 Tax=Pleuronectes platessa TaxID=8262 RepID=A0A9N7TJ19_PLEPL|nr:unnamed protein product [Pleuronectes platessa]